ncbi:1-acyl-sn-glycerol-3-phosphate acyltransferase [Haloactinopolyspora alba]|uniref:1-acyl-sn-glycerol-3-phosphate acyltransferase n=2 Tax=Haloactinopolyspora alba TaxID=648780 RepID=A0A2P8E8W2_9ACTN|nr:1-acyl-sn-glycerol-3-phosphate acyltransferase [Haloactinopolyspora alba]
MTERRRRGHPGAGVAFRFIALVLRPILMSVTRRNWRGGEYIPPPGTGVVVAANHVSHFDPLTFAHFLWDNGRATRYLAKDSVFRIPVVGRVVSAARQIPVYRESRDASQAYRAAVSAVNDGELVAIYPEGTITRDPDLWPMVGKTGAARVALETGRDVVPIAQWGPQHVLAPYTKRLRLFPRKTVYVNAGPPVDLSDLRDQPMTTAVMRDATDRIVAAITAELAQIRGEIPPAERFDARAAGLPLIGDPSDGPVTDDRPVADDGPVDDGGPAADGESHNEDGGPPTDGTTPGREVP